MTRLARTYPLRALAVAALLSLAAIPLVSADALAPPSNLDAVQQGEGVLLTWDAPPGESPDAYRIYVDGALEQTQEANWIVLPESVTYAVSAIYGGGYESRAAVVMWGPSSQPAENGEDDCDPLPTTINTTQPPFIFPGLQLDCFNWVLRLVDELINNHPVP